MTQTGKDAALAVGARATFLDGVRKWWERRGELARMDRSEVDRIAADLGMTARDLEDLAARGPDAAALLYRRMEALSLSRADVDGVALGLLRDLERTCSCCNHKGVCEQDLASRPGDTTWKEYCANAASLVAVVDSKGRFPA